MRALVSARPQSRFRPRPGRDRLEVQVSGMHPTVCSGTDRRTRSGRGNDTQSLTLARRSPTPLASQRLTEGHMNNGTEPAQPDRLTIRLRDPHSQRLRARSCPGPCVSSATCWRVRPVRARVARLGASPESGRRAGVRSGTRPARPSAKSRPSRGRLGDTPGAGPG